MGHYNDSTFIKNENTGNYYGVEHIRKLALDSVAHKHQEHYIHSCSAYMDTTPRSTAEAVSLVEWAENEVIGDERFIVSADRMVIIPVVADADVITTTKKVRVTLPAADIAKLRQIKWWANATVAKQVGGYMHAATPVKLPATRKPIATATEGKTVTRYAVVVSTAHGEYEYKDSKGNTLFNSQSEARQVALEVAEKKEGSFISIHVVGKVVREDGNQSLVVITQPEKDGVVEYEVTTKTVKPNAKVDGWMVFYDYHN